VSNLNLKEATFVTDSYSSASSEADLYIASDTFYDTNLSGLKTLDLSEIIFMVDNINENVEKYIHTASFTFAYANLSELINLNMNGAKFAGINMLIGDTDSGGRVLSGDNTFFNALLSNLTELNLSNSIFAIDNAVTMSNSRLYSGYQTFKNADLSKLSTLNLSKTMLQTPSMDTSVMVHNPVYETFNSSNFSSLTEIYLPTTTQSYS
jgi:hypothetical protein